MRQLVFGLILAVVAAFPVAAAPITMAVPSGHYVMDPTHASLTWKVRHFGLSNYTARFSKFSASVELDASDVAKSKLSVAVDPLSVRTDYPYPEKENFDAKIGATANFMNGGLFPEITFVSTSIVPNGADNATITGNLTFRGVTKAVALQTKLIGVLAEHPFTKKAGFGISAHGTIKRSDFGMDYGLAFVGDDVELLIEAEFVKEAQ